MGIPNEPQFQICADRLTSSALCEFEFVLHFRGVALFRNAGDSEGTVGKNRGQISDFISPLVKIRGGTDEMSESILQVQSRNQLWYAFDKGTV